MVASIMWMLITPCKQIPKESQEAGVNSKGIGCPEVT